MSQNEESQALEMSIEQAREKIDLGLALDRLKSNPDFKKVFLDKYLSSYALRLVNLKAAHQMQDEKNQTYIVNQLNAIGHLTQYMHFIVQEAYHSAKALADSEQELESLRSEV